uniref:Mor transcription activator family protein n=1 Tax=Candidatus Kentrum sp. UNK TaxID=2126344 RepID=A0A451AQL9_9GAMM|nr:MAG: Mor transcription activator family protein [Candidatus Kentron sp. UNK]VFK68327.1 MAG: Mor transcription activator family protein [Candidatus Kentron sp. UNK]
MSPPMPLTNEDLPKDIRLLVDLVGIEKTRRIVEAYGGTSLRVPAAGSKGGRLAALIGEEEARAIIRVCAGTPLYIPRMYKTILAVRNARIRNAFREGATAARIALAHDLTERRIREILAEDKHEHAPDGAARQLAFDFAA